MYTDVVRPCLAVSCSRPATRLNRPMLGRARESTSRAPARRRRRAGRTGGARDAVSAIHIDWSSPGPLQLKTSSWHHSKLEYGTRAILLPRAQNRRRKVRMVRRIGVMLRLQRQAITEMIDSAAFAGDAAIEEIAGIKLEARLGSGDLHRATTRWLDDARSEYQHI